MSRGEPSIEEGVQGRMARGYPVHSDILLPESSSQAPGHLLNINHDPDTQARLAQSVERETLNLNVVGSSPTLGVRGSLAQLVSVGVS